MKDKYPKKGEFIRYHPNEQKKCIVCGKRADGKLLIQVNWFRGDDDVFKLCKECTKGSALTVLERIGEEK